VNALSYVNDATNVNVWQDIFVTDSSEPQAAQPAEPPASGADLLKALADPLRMRMMYALTRNTAAGPPVMSVKELAAELDEPKTKLYRHIKHLAAVGLIAAVDSRVVSGLVEQRYQVVRGTLVTDDELTASERTSPEAEGMVAAALEMFRREYFGALRSALADQHMRDSDNRRPLLALTDGQLPAARAAAIRDQLRELVDEVSEAPDPEADDLVPVNLLIGFFRAEPPPSS
jgi:DNA-binding transcriptional ArsR family regulator